SAPQYSASFYSFNVTATAQDSYGNTLTGYTGTVHFTSSDSGATLPADCTFTASDQGSHTFAVTLQTTGNQSVSVSDTANPTAAGTATIADYNYIPGLHFLVNPSVTTTTAGSPFSVTVTALNQYNNVAIHYLGTVQFWTIARGPSSVVLANYT